MANLVNVPRCTRWHCVAALCRETKERKKWNKVKCWETLLIPQKKSSFWRCRTSPHRRWNERWKNPYLYVCVTLLVHIHLSPNLPTKMVQRKWHCITAVIVFHFIIFTFKSSSRKLTQKFNFLFYFFSFVRFFCSCSGVCVCWTVCLCVLCCGRATVPRAHTTHLYIWLYFYGNLFCLSFSFAQSMSSRFVFILFSFLCCCCIFLLSATLRRCHILNGRTNTFDTRF